MLRCAFCKTELGYIHGHAACVRSGCPMFGVNQAECCSGETAENGPLTAEVAASENPWTAGQGGAHSNRTSS